MSQLYSGNLEAFKWAINRLNRAGLITVKSREYSDAFAGMHTVNIEIYEPDDVLQPLNMRKFWHRDIDVLYITMTEWLNRQAEAYESWK